MLYLRTIFLDLSLCRICSNEPFKIVSFLCDFLRAGLSNKESDSVAFGKEWLWKMVAVAHQGSSASHVKGNRGG